MRDMEKLINELVVSRNKELRGYNVLIIEIKDFLDSLLIDLRYDIKRIRGSNDVYANYVTDSLERLGRIRLKIEMGEDLESQYEMRQREFKEVYEKYSCCTKATNCFFYSIYCLLCCCVFEGIKDCCDSVTWAPHLSSSDESVQAVIRQTNLSTSYHNQRMNNNFNHNITVTRTGQGTYWN